MDDNSSPLPGVNPLQKHRDLMAAFVAGHASVQKPKQNQQQQQQPGAGNQGGGGFGIHLPGFSFSKQNAPKSDVSNPNAFGQSGDPYGNAMLPPVQGDASSMGASGGGCGS